MPIFFNWPIHHGGDHLHLEPPHLCCWFPSSLGLTIGTFNIHDEWGFGLALAIQLEQTGSFNIMILMRTKFTNQAYCHNRLGYNMVYSPEIMIEYGGAQGVAVLVVQDQPKGWSVELKRFHGPNVVSCDFITQVKWTPLIGPYLPSFTLDHLMDLEEAQTRLQDQYSIF